MIEDYFDEEFVAERMKILQAEQAEAAKSVGTYIIYLLDWRQKHIDCLRNAELDLQTERISEALAEEILATYNTNMAFIDAELTRLGWDALLGSRKN